VGAFRNATDGIFRWRSGVELPTDSHLWAPGEPLGTSRCVQVWADSGYYFDDIDCSRLKGALCECQL